MDKVKVRAVLLTGLLKVFIINLKSLEGASAWKI